MNRSLTRTNLLLFTLERCDDYNQGLSELFGKDPQWRVRAHDIFGWHPAWGPFEPTRTHAILSWIGYVWDDFYKN